MISPSSSCTNSNTTTSCGGAITAAAIMKKNNSTNNNIHKIHSIHLTVHLSLDGLFQERKHHCCSSRNGLKEQVKALIPSANIHTHTQLKLREYPTLNYISNGLRVSALVKSNAVEKLSKACVRSFHFLTVVFGAPLLTVNVMRFPCMPLMSMVCTLNICVICNFYSHIYEHRYLHKLFLRKNYLIQTIMSKPFLNVSKYC